MFIRSYGPLFLVTLMLTAFNCAYVVIGVPYSAFAQLIASHTMLICLASWVQSDARLRRSTPCYDFGMFVLFGWFFTVPMYLIWTRGWRGVPIALMFLGLWIAPTFIAMLVWDVLVILAWRAW